MPVVRMPDGQLVDMPDNPDPKLLAELQLLTPRTSSSFGGAATEAIKGIGRGSIGLAQDIGEKLNPMAAVPGNWMPRSDPALQQANQQLKQAMAPDPQATSLEKGAGWVGEFGGGMLVGGPFKQGANIATALPRKAAPALKSVGRELYEAHIPILPSQTGAGRIQRGLEGFGRSEASAFKLRRQAQPELQKLAHGETTLAEQGVAATGLTEKALNASSKAIADETYAPIRALPTIHLGSHNVGRSGYSSTFQKQLDDIYEANKYIKEAPELNRVIESFRAREMPPNIVLSRIQQVRNEASKAYKNKERDFGKALNMVDDAIEAQIERNLVKNSPNLVEAYKAGRAKIARNNAVKDMLVDKFSGTIDPTKAHDMLEGGARLTGGLETIAKAGSPIFSHTTRPPIGESTLFNWRDAGLMGTPVLARAYTTSKAGQRAAAGPAIGAPPQMLGMDPDTLQRLGIGGYSMFSQ